MTKTQAKYFEKLGAMTYAQVQNEFWRHVAAKRCAEATLCKNALAGTVGHEARQLAYLSSFVSPEATTGTNGAVRY